MEITWGNPAVGANLLSYSHPQNKKTWAVVLDGIWTWVPHFPGHGLIPMLHTSPDTWMFLNWTYSKLQCVANMSNILTFYHIIHDNLMMMMMIFQRRWWGPSSMANVVDLLGSSNEITNRNPSMSKPYMLYQLFGLASSILAPSTVVLMIADKTCFHVQMKMFLSKC